MRARMVPQCHSSVPPITAEHYFEGQSEGLSVKTPGYVRFRR
jgi:hypothetical protein